MSAPSSLFRFSQVELPWALGPPDGRYLLREPGAGSDAPPSHILVLATLGARERRRLGSHRYRQVRPEPEPALVATGRATIVEVGDPLPGPSEARKWLKDAGEDELAADLAVLNRGLHAFRIATADPYLNPVGRQQVLVARIGFGAGEEVADGLWREARELPVPGGRRRRARLLDHQAHLAAILTDREPALACAELTLRARLDLSHGREREAALQVLIALDAAMAELALDAAAPALAERLSELSAQRDAIAIAAQSALSGPLSSEDREAVAFTLGRIEAALRARTAAGD